jgi:acyl carrier protein
LLGVQILEALTAGIAKYLEVDVTSLTTETTLGSLNLDSLDIVSILEEVSTLMDAFVEIDPDADRSVPFADTTLVRFSEMLVAHPD